MKNITAIFLGLLFIMAAQAPDNRSIILDQFNRTQGDWDGYLEYTEGDNRTKMAMPAKCTTKLDGEIWIYEVHYDDGTGEVVGGGGEFKVNPEGTKLDNNGIVWNILEVSQSGDSAKIVMETPGKDNRKKATLRRTLEVTSTTFSILEEAKYLKEGDYFERNKHLFRKKKK